eukprot:gene9910-2232_t
MVLAHVQILGSSTVDIDPSILLFFENKRYLFNVGESTLRFCNENKVKLGRVTNFFVSSIQPESIGGLPGLLMTMDDFGKSQISITGPKNLTNYLQCLRFCLLRHKLNLDVNEIDEKKSKKIIHKDENLQITTILTCVKNEIKKEIEQTSFDCYHNFVLKNQSKPKSEEPPNKKLKSTGIKEEESFVHDEKNLKKKNVQISEFKKVKEDNSILTFICETPQVKGKFDTNKAKQLGLKPGPSYAHLKNGQSVTLENGNVITPEMVLGKEQKGSCFILIFCSHEEFMIPLIENEEWKKYFEKSTLIIHATNNSIFRNEKYQQFISKFNQHCQHMVINKDVCQNRIIFNASGELQCKLNMINEKIFPISNFNNNILNNFPLKNYIIGDPLQNFILAQSNKMEIGLDSSNTMIEYKTKDIQHSISKINKELIKEIEIYKNIKKSKFDESNEHEKMLNELSEGEFEIIFLGTGCAIPSKYRNVTSIMLKMKNYGNILFDCGEGTIGQIYRIFGDESNEILKNIKLIWISHLHGDHHLGLSKLLFHRQKLLKENENKITIISHSRMETYLKEYQLICNLNKKLDYDFISNEEIENENHSKLEKVYEELGIKMMFNVPVIHSKDAYGLILEHSKKWKLVFSGDTRPCKDLIKSGKGSTILIHEATFEDDLIKDAIDKKHSTTSEAIESGIEMNSYRVILNHFSQRYPKIPIFNSNYNEN